MLSVPEEVEIEKGKKQTFWRDVRPIMLRGRFGTVKPLYFLKWNSLYPMEFQVRNETKEFVNTATGEKITFEQKTIEPVTPTFKDTKMLPELLGETHDMRFLKGMKKYVTGERFELPSWLPILLFILALGGLGYLIYYFFLSGGAGA